MKGRLEGELQGRERRLEGVFRAADTECAPPNPPASECPRYCKAQSQKDTNQTTQIALVVIRDKEDTGNRCKHGLVKKFDNNAFSNTKQGDARTKLASGG